LWRFMQASLIVVFVLFSALVYTLNHIADAPCSRLVSPSFSRYHSGICPLPNAFIMVRDRSSPGWECNFGGIAANHGHHKYNKCQTANRIWNSF
jgi:hypothetical protein